MQNTAKSTGSTKKRKLWKVFRKNRKQIYAYPMPDDKEEEEATIALLAFENNCRKRDIHVMLEMR